MNRSLTPSVLCTSKNIFCTSSIQLLFKFFSHPPLMNRLTRANHVCKKILPLLFYNILCRTVCWSFFSEFPNTSGCLPCSLWSSDHHSFGDLCPFFYLNHQLSHLKKKITLYIRKGVGEPLHLCSLDDSLRLDRPDRTSRLDLRMYESPKN